MDVAAGRPPAVRGRQPADAVYYVVSGCLGVVAPGGELIGRVAAGESVGEIGLIVSRPRARPCGHCATRNSRRCRRNFERVLLSHPEAIRGLRA